MNFARTKLTKSQIDALISSYEGNQLGAAAFKHAPACTTPSADIRQALERAHVNPVQYAIAFDAMKALFENKCYTHKQNASGEATDMLWAMNVARGLTKLGLECRLEFRLGHGDDVREYASVILGLTD